MTKSTIWTIERKVRNSYVYKHVNKTFLDWYVKFSLHITKKYMHTVHIYVDTVHARKHMPKWGNAKISNSRFSIGWIENRHIITMGWISKDRFIAPLWKLRCVGVEFQLLFFFENRCHTCRLDVFFARNRAIHCPFGLWKGSSAVKERTTKCLHVVPKLDRCDTDLFYSRVIKIHMEFFCFPWKYQEKPYIYIHIWFSRKHYASSTGGPLSWISNVGIFFVSIDLGKSNSAVFQHFVWHSQRPAAVPCGWWSLEFLSSFASCKTLDCRGSQSW